MTVIPTREILDSGTGGYGRLAREVREGRLVRLRRGVVRPAGDLSPDERLLAHIEAAALTILGGTLFSHKSAAMVHGLPVYVRADTPVEVIRTLGGHGQRNALLHARAARLEPDECAVVDGLPVTSIVRTTLDLVRTLPFTQGVMVADAALRLGVDRDALLAAVPAGKGCRKAEDALTFADPASESPGESESRAQMAGCRIVMPKLQVALYDSRGRFVGRPDFYWAGKALVGEYDGEDKYRGRFGVSPADAVLEEKRRQGKLTAAGFHVVRWGKDTLRTPGGLCRLIRRELAGRPDILARG